MDDNIDLLAAGQIPRRRMNLPAGLEAELLPGFFLRLSGDIGGKGLQSECVEDIGDTDVVLVGGVFQHVGLGKVSWSEV